MNNKSLVSKSSKLNLAVDSLTVYSNNHGFNLKHLFMSNLNILEEEINQSKLTLDLFLDA